MTLVCRPLRQPQTRNRTRASVCRMPRPIKLSESLQWSSGILLLERVLRECHQVRRTILRLCSSVIKTRSLTPRVVYSISRVPESFDKDLPTTATAPITAYCKSSTFCNRNRKSRSIRERIQVHACRCRQPITRNPSCALARTCIRIAFFSTVATPTTSSTKWTSHRVSVSLLHCIGG